MTPELLKGDLRLLIWNPEDPRRRGVALTDPSALPLRTNDQIRIEAHLNRPAYVYLVWIDSQGIASPVYPWTPGRWDKRPAKENPTAQISLPAAADQGWPMQGPSGMETLLLLARDTPLPEEVDLAQLLAGLPEQAMQEARALVRSTNGKPISRPADAERGPQFSNPQEIDDAVLQTQRRIQERLGAYFSLNEAVSFAHRGENPQ